MKPNDETWGQSYNNFKAVKYDASVVEISPNSKINLYLVWLYNYNLLSLSGYMIGHWHITSVTRLGDLLDFWQVFKAFCNN